RADFPVRIDSMDEAEAAVLLERELTEEQIAFAMKRRAITQARHDAAEPIDLIVAEQQVVIETGSCRWRVVQTVRESGAFEENRLDAVVGQGVENGDQFRREQQFVR